MPEATQWECNEDSGGFRKGCEGESVSLYYSVHAAITKHPDLGGLCSEISVLTVLAARSPRSRCRQGWFLLRLLSLACIPSVIQYFSPAIYFTHNSVYILMLLSPFIPLSSPTVSISLFSISMSPFLPCTYDLEWRGGGREGRLRREVINV